MLDKLLRCLSPYNIIFRNLIVIIYIIRLVYHLKVVLNPLTLEIISFLTKYRVRFFLSDSPRLSKRDLDLSNFIIPYLLDLDFSDL